MMEGPGKISIIVPVYNAEDTLERCISSILGQTYHDLQILLVDDGSTDGSYGICQQFALIDKRIEVCHTENKGSVAARKTGLKLAVGDYIGFVDADDYIEPDLFIKLLEMLMKTNADFVHSGYVEERQGNKKIICNFDEAVFKMHDIQSKINFLQEFVLNGINDNNISSSIWSKLFQAGFIKKCFEPLSDKQQYGEDLLCLCRCVLESRCLVLDRIAGYHYDIKKC